ncbi:MAG: Aminomethyltransferase (glycine cleavage system T protein) [uncultured Thermomicrobiales bacterium]|uniref:Aminomethyltransferase n=1 Tax=uncultured Thermomicrobiales bacterium TaxID=1645740 RepID=A0A6J4TKD4_9BACT|nr:MAG: Aminomethyltransferase (glycine cleavage system T protein) [uncultured Thermomicrobiales bacterium]
MSESQEPNAAALGEGAGEPLRTTPLRDRHAALGARLVPFAGWEMPVQYAGIMAEHRAVRGAAGLFDLGHMGQVEVSGPDALAYLQAVTTNDVAALAPGKAQYSLLPNERGGVIDDVIVYRRPDGDGYMVVVNASNRDKDVAWLLRHRGLRPDLDVAVEDRSDRTGMIAIQGPKAAAIVGRLTEAKLAAIGDFAWAGGSVAGVPAMIARTGYTGEDGFEFYTARDRVGDLWDALLEAGDDDGLMPVGLGARDTLRLEARMPLYGNELADDIGPLEAGLGWAVKLDKGPFVGRDAIAAMKETGPPRRTVGFRCVERGGSPRSHFPVLAGGREIGRVTSGAMSPTLGHNIGLALIEQDAAGVGKPLAIDIRGRPVAAVQVKTPFYKRARPETASGR